MILYLSLRSKYRYKTTMSNFQVQLIAVLQSVQVFVLRVGFNPALPTRKVLFMLALQVLYYLQNIVFLSLLFDLMFNIGLRN